jgi:zinc protease
MKLKKLQALATVLLWTVFPAAAFAQGHGDSISHVERLNRAPVNKQVLQVHLPRPSETKLPNGLTVLVLEQHRLPTVAFTLWIKAGALDDPKDLPGLAKFTADMLREGTAHRSSSQLAADIDDIGATLNASAAFGSSISTISASGLVENTDRILELMSDLVVNPLFPADELEKYRTRELAELERQRSEPGFLSREKFHEVLYRGFPAAVYSATPDSVKRVSPDQLKRFHDQYYVPGNAILGVIGDVKVEQVVPLIRKYFGEWKDHPVKPVDTGTVPPPSPFKIYLINRPNSVQTNIVAGDYTVRRSDPDFIPLTVMNQVVGNGPQARLFLNLREEHGYTYGAYSFFAADTYPGPWQAFTEVRNAVTDGSMHELMYELKRIREQKVPASELDDAHRAIIAGFALSLERPEQLLDRWLTVDYYGLPHDYWERYPEQIARVSPEAVEQAAKKYVDLDHLQVVCVGDGNQAGNAEGKKIRDVLKGYGPLEVYDADGKRIE